MANQLFHAAAYLTLFWIQTNPADTFDSGLKTGTQIVPYNHQCFRSRNYHMIVASQ